MAEIETKRGALLSLISEFGSCAVAFSGGVDSAVVAKAAQLALGENAIAVTGQSASVAQGEIALATEVAEAIGIRHRIIATNEFENPQYVDNAKDRCYHCKNELYDQIGAMIGDLAVNVIANGANLDDTADYRPGMQAAAQHRVRSPLAECGFTKSDVRELAAAWKLAVAEKPASPCLSSRVAYGEEVTPERLEMIDRAEQLLRGMGLREVRVRYHRGDLARIEVAPEAIGRLCEPSIRSQLVEHLRESGFKFVTIDLQGFRSGSLNDLIQIEPAIDLSFSDTDHLDL